MTHDKRDDHHRRSLRMFSTPIHLLLFILTCISSVVHLATSLSTTTPYSTTNDPIHTLILTRHGDSQWNGKAPGSRETFTGWTDVPLSSVGEAEAVRTGTLLSQYTSGSVVVDALFTSALGRARLTAHHCWWAYYRRLESEHRREMLLRRRDDGRPPHDDWAPKRFVIDHRLNERHYGSLQGLVKADVEAGMHGHSPSDVKLWRRSWHAVPPPLEEDDPRRLREIRLYRDICGGVENVPRGESLAMVARERIRPFLEESLTPLLEDAYYSRSKQWGEDDDDDATSISRNYGGGTALIVAHANSLRALIGVICNVEEDPAALRKLEKMKIPTATPLVLRYRRIAESGVYLPVDCVVGSETKKTDLPVYPLSSVNLTLLNGSKPEHDARREEESPVKEIAATIKS